MVVIQDSARLYCEFWNRGGLCKIKPDGDDRCKYWREDQPRCIYLTSYVLKGGRGNKKKPPGTKVPKGSQGNLKTRDTIAGRVG